MMEMIVAGTISFSLYLKFSVSGNWRTRFRETVYMDSSDVFISTVLVAQSTGSTGTRFSAISESLCYVSFSSLRSTGRKNLSPGLTTSVLFAMLLSKFEKRDCTSPDHFFNFSRLF